jgi:threonine synthase
MVPETAPTAKLTQIIMYGAQIVRVKGSYDDAFDMSIEATREHGWYNRNTAFNPLTIEGKKTVSYELFDQLKYQLPDRIFVSVGDGVILSGVYKGFEDLLKIGIIDRMPVVVAVQAAGSDNLVRNLEGNDFAVKTSQTIADSISVDVPRNFLMARGYMHQYGGEALTVNDKEILQASAMLSRNTGLFTEPASAAAFAGLQKYKDQGRIEAKSDNVVLLTGSGLKDVDAVKNYLQS